MLVVLTGWGAFRSADMFLFCNGHKRTKVAVLEQHFTLIRLSDANFIDGAAVRSLLLLVPCGWSEGIG